MLLTLKPANPRDQWWLAQAMTLAGEDRRHAMADRPADWAGNAESVRRSPRLLAGIAIRQLWSFRAIELDFSSHVDRCARWLLPVRLQCSLNWSRGLEASSVSRLSRCAKQSKLWRPNRAIKMHLSATSRRSVPDRLVRWPQSRGRQGDAGDPDERRGAGRLDARTVG